MTLFDVTFERRHRCSGPKSPGNAMSENPNGIQSIPKTRARYDEALRLPSAFAAHRLQSRSDSQPVSLAPPRNDIRIFSRVPRCCLGNAEGYRSTRGHVSITITSRLGRRWLTLGNYIRKCATNMFGPGFPMIIHKSTLVMKNSVSILPANPHILTPRSAFAKLCPPLAHFRM